MKKQLLGLTDGEPFEETAEQAEKTSIAVKDTTKETEKLKESLDKVSKTSFSKVTAGLKKVGTMAGTAVKATAKVTVAGIGAASAGVAAMVASSVGAYSNYEQLVGGVDTLFKNSSSTVQKYANDAYKTAGLTANKYMETVTSFSANLLQSLGGDTKKAAEYGNMAVVDMADNANKMGTDMSSIIETYQSLARGNYEMLDNLKLGYGGTKTEMQRLIKDAAKLDKSVDANSTSYANLVKAIHTVQENMGITGTTSKEASTTIRGSFASLRSTWGNLMTSLVVGGDSFDQCLTNLVDSAKTFGKNIMPAVRKGLKGVGRLITEIVPYIEAEIPGIVNELLPPLLAAATALISGLIKSLPSAISTLVKELPNIIGQIGNAIAEAFGTQFPALGSAGTAIIDNAKNIANIVPYIIGTIASFKIFKTVFSGINSITSMFGKSDKTFKKINDPLASIGKADTKGVLKGMVNIAVMIGGLTAITAAVMLVAPHMDKLSGLNSVVKMIGSIGALGTVGAVLAKFAAIVGKIPVMTVVKGLVNMGIMIGGMSAVYAVVGLVSSFSFDNKKIIELAGIFGILGIVGGAASVFAGIAGIIPIPVVLAGLANIALVIAGFTAIIAAFGALGQIQGFNEFIATGGETLANLFKQIGKIGGALIGGLGEGISTALPGIGENLSKFAQAVKPMFTAFSGADLGGIGEFFSAMGGFLLKMAGDGFLSIFTGGTDLGELGKELTTFSESSRGFFDNVSSFPQQGFANAKLMFEALGDISNVPNTGGIAQWFSGTNDFRALAEGLNDLSGEGVVKFFNTVSQMPQGGFENAKNLFGALSKISSLPNTGGFFQWFSGENDIAGIAEKLPPFGKAASEFYNSISGISDFGRIEALFTSLKSASGIESITNLVIKNINTIVKKVSELPRKMGDALKSSGESLSSSMAEIWKDAVDASVAPVNKLLDGANWILKEFGSDKRIAKWTPYAKGTDGHKGGNALVNDGRGAELVQMPNGNTFIPKGRTVFIPNAPRGMKVLSAEDTANVMGRKSPTFRYSDGNTDIWDYLDDAKGLIGKVKEKYVNYNGITGLALNIGKGLVSTINGEMIPWAKKLMDEFGALSLASYNPSKGVEQWRTTVIRALKMEGQYSAANVARTLYQMHTESGGNPRAINNWDSNAKKGTPSKGLMQVIDPTFAAYARPGFNKNIYDPLSNILASIRYAISRYGSLARAYRGHGYANGGIATKPSIFGEAGAEMAIPLSARKRKRGIGLWMQTGELLGLGRYTPENAPTTGGKVNQNITYSAPINITVNGDGNSRQTARSVKNAVREAMKEMMESFEYSNKPIREF